MSAKDIVLKPVYLPLVQQLAKYLARYEQPAMWRTAGQAVDLSSLLKGKANRIVLTPAGERLRVGGDAGDVLELGEQGIYEVSGVEINQVINAFANTDIFHGHTQQFLDSDDHPTFGRAI